MKKIEQHDVNKDSDPKSIYNFRKRNPNTGMKDSAH